MQTQRLFIALDFEPAMLKGLAEVMLFFQKQKMNNIRWVNPNQIHLTLRFLGETRLDQTDQIKENLRTTCRHHAPFDISIEGSGCFPNIKQPKVIWVGVKAPIQLISLQREIEKDIRTFGFEPENRAFTPHLTLGRVSQAATIADQMYISKLMREFEINLPGHSRVDHVTLYKSKLTQTGPSYEAWGKFVLGELDS